VWVIRPEATSPLGSLQGAAYIDSCAQAERMHGSPCTIVRAEVVLHPARSDHLLANQAGMVTDRPFDPHLYRSRSERALLKSLADFEVKQWLMPGCCIAVVWCFHA